MNFGLLSSGCEPRPGDKSFVDEAATIRAIVDRVRPGARTLLDVGCGTGGHLVHVRERLEVACHRGDRAVQLVDGAHVGVLAKLDLGGETVWTRSLPQGLRGVFADGADVVADAFPEAAHFSVIDPGGS